MRVALPLKGCSAAYLEAALLISLMLISSYWVCLHLDHSLKGYGFFNLIIQSDIMAEASRLICIGGTDPEEVCAELLSDAMRLLILFIQCVSDA